MRSRVKCADLTHVPAIEDKNGACGSCKGSRSLIYQPDATTQSCLGLGYVSLHMSVWMSLYCSYIYTHIYTCILVNV